MTKPKMEQGYSQILAQTFSEAEFAIIATAADLAKNNLAVSESPVF